MEKLANFRQKFNNINSSGETSESIFEFENEIDEHLRDLERELENELEKRREIANNIGMVQAQISELWDRVDKARRRETDISYRVTAWAQHLTEQMNMVRDRKMKIGHTLDSSATLSAEIGHNLEKLIQKRDNVQRMREEIDVRRHLHKQQLKTIKDEMDEQETEILHWNQISDDISNALISLKDNRDVLLARVEVEMRQEAEQKRILDSLESMLRTASMKNRGKNYKNRSEPRSHTRYITSFSTLTDESM